MGDETGMQNSSVSRRGTGLAELAIDIGRGFEMIIISRVNLTLLQKVGTPAPYWLVAANQIWTSKLAKDTPVS